jgi:diguanylate cyclase (GGDEF)-like protein/PAS domain S-box-containing protein
VRDVDAGEGGVTHSAAIPKRSPRTRSRFLAKRWNTDIVEGGALVRLLFDDSPIPAQGVDDEGRIVVANDAMLQLLGYERGQYLGRHIGEVAHPEGQPEEEALLADVRSGAREHYEIRRRLRQADGSLVAGRFLVGAARDSEGGLVGVVAQFIDESTVFHLQEEMRRARLFHNLTGLPHWELVLDRVDHALSVARESGCYVGVADVDLDRFVLVNDEFGNDVGNALMIAIGERLGARLERADTLGHLSGDEFVAIRPDLGSPSALGDFGREVAAAFVEPFSLGRYEITVSASIGLAVGGHDAISERLIRDAQLAREQARKGGGGRFVIFESSQRTQALINENSRTSLVHAYEAEQLTIHYQPVIALETNECVGVEALLRWNDPASGAWLPREFIRAAEETELIVPIGAMVLRTACAQAVAWADELESIPRVSVNVSPVQLEDLGFLEAVGAALVCSGLPAENLTLELTESALMGDDSEIRRTLEALRRLGVRVSIDDFGTGYSSLGRIRRLAVDELKIDREFVSEMDADESARQIVLAIIELARALSATVVAEGVETEATADLLRELGCPFAQGYLFGRPSSPEECYEAFAAANHSSSVASSAAEESAIPMSAS